MLRMAAVVSRFAKRLHFIRTAGVPVAAQIDVAVALDKVDLQHAHRLHVAVIQELGVPSLDTVAVAVQEDDGFGEFVVVVDDVL